MAISKKTVSVLCSTSRPLPNFIFMSRWPQLSLYLGLILAQGVYVFHFRVELPDLVGAALSNPSALEHILNAAASEGALVPFKLNETTIMLAVLGLIDMIMISNLLIMVIVYGYETFVSCMKSHPDRPEWPSHMNAPVLEMRLATAIIGISPVHLLKTFIKSGKLQYQDNRDATRAPCRLPFLGHGDHLLRRPQHGRHTSLRQARPLILQQESS